MWKKLVIELQYENEKPRSVSVNKEDFDVYISKTKDKSILDTKDILYLLYNMLNEPTDQ